MANIISLALYGTHNRYWGNLPYLFICYEQTYMKVISDLKLRIYLHGDCRNYVDPRQKAHGFSRGDE